MLISTNTENYVFIYFQCKCVFFIKLATSLSWQSSKCGLPDFEQVYLIFKLGRPMSTALTVLMSNSATHVLDVEGCMALDVTQTPTRPATSGTLFNVLIC